MAKIGWPIAITSAVLLIYCLSVLLGSSYALVFSLFLLLNVFTIWMVFAILIKGQPSGKSFEDTWYDDMP